MSSYPGLQWQIWSHQDEYVRKILACLSGSTRTQSVTQMFSTLLIVQFIQVKSIQTFTIMRHPGRLQQLHCVTCGDRILIKAQPLVTQQSLKYRRIFVLLGSFYISRIDFGRSYFYSYSGVWFWAFDTSTRTARTPHVHACTSKN